jgi:hypothetical protein
MLAQSAADSDNALLFMGVNTNVLTMLTTAQLKSIGDLTPAERILVESHLQANAEIERLNARINELKACLATASDV